MQDRCLYFMDLLLNSIFKNNLTLDNILERTFEPSFLSSIYKKFQNSNRNRDIELLIYNKSLFFNLNKLYF